MQHSQGREKAVAYETPANSQTESYTEAAQLQPEQKLYTSGEHTSEGENQIVNEDPSKQISHNGS